MTKISELPAATSAVPADQFPATQAGSTRRITGAQVLAYVQGEIGADLDALDARVESLEGAPPAHTHPADAISDSTAAGRALLTAASATAQRVALGLTLGPVVLVALDYANAWDVPAAAAEFGAGRNRTPRLDLTTMSQCRLSVAQAGEFVNGAALRLQYSLDNGATWPGYLGMGDGPEVADLTAYADRDSGWVALNPSAQADGVTVRLVGFGGDGSTVGYFGNVYVEFR